VYSYFWRETRVKGGRSFDFAIDETLLDYDPTAEAMGASSASWPPTSSAPELVAEVIWEAANDTSDLLRFRAGPDAHALLDERKTQDDAKFIGRIKDDKKG
jgi:hypothetical protein